MVTAFRGNHVAQIGFICAMRRAGLDGFARQDFGNKALDHFGHGAEFLRFFGQQPGIEGAATHGNALSKGIAGHI